MAKGARNREYIGAVEWLEKAGVVNICHCLGNPELPLKGNYDADTYKVYYHDTGLLIASLDEEAQEDLRANKNFGTYKGAIYENVVGEMLRKSGYEQLYYYKNDNPALEMDFFVRDSDSLVPIEVKAKDGATASLNHLIDWPSFPDVSFDRQVHISPAAVYPQLQRLTLILYGVVVFDGELAHIRHPVGKAHRPLKIQLDHVALLFVVDIIVDLVPDTEGSLQGAVAVTDRRIVDGIRNGTRMIVILAGINKVLFKRQALISHYSHPV